MTQHNHSHISLQDCIQTYLKNSGVGEAVSHNGMAAVLALFQPSAENHEFVYSVPVAEIIAEAARALRDQCAEAGIAFHFKQWGEWAPDHNHMAKVGKKRAGCLLDGVEHKAFPTPKEP